LRLVLALAMAATAAGAPAAVAPALPMPPSPSALLCTALLCSASLLLAGCYHKCEDTAHLLSMAACRWPCQQGSPSGHPRTLTPVPLMIAVHTGRAGTPARTCAHTAWQQLQLLLLWEPCHMKVHSLQLVCSGIAPLHLQPGSHPHSQPASPSYRAKADNKAATTCSLPVTRPAL